MAKGVNKVILVGNLGKDPELKYLESGTAVCKFSLATSDSFKNKDGEQETRTEWHNIVTWARLAEICSEHLRKGKQIYIDGRIKTRSWDGDDGKKRYMTEVIGDNMVMLGRVSDQPEAPTDTPKPDASPDDDLPF